MAGGSDTIYTGNVITAEQFNDLMNRYGMFWRGESYEFDENHNTTNDLRRYGWGQAPVYPIVNQYTPIEAAHYNHLVTQVNAGLFHIDEELFLTSEQFRMVKRNTKTPIAAELYTKIIDFLNTTIETRKFDVDAVTTDLAVVETVSDNLPWTNTLNVEHRFRFPDYNTARHFFNSGGKLSLDLSVATVNDASGAIWQNILENMSVVHISAITTDASGNANVTLRKGFYNISPTLDPGDPKSTIIFTAVVDPYTSYNGYSGYSGYSGYGGYCGYSGYSGYGGEYCQRRINIHASCYEDVFGFSLAFRIELVEPTATDMMPITSTFVLASGYVVPETTPEIDDPNISLFTENTTNTVYQFERRAIPVIHELTGWYPV